MGWWREHKERKHQRLIADAVEVIRRAALEMLREPNSNAIRSKTFWASCLLNAGVDSSALNEALRQTSHPMPSTGPALGTDAEMWEADIGQPNLIFRVLTGVRQRNRG